MFSSTSGVFELWGLTTTAEYRALRTKLYRDIPSVEVRALLKRRFPTGSCKSFVLGEKSKSRAERGAAFVDDDATTSIIDNLAKSLMRDWQKSREQSEMV